MNIQPTTSRLRGDPVSNQVHAAFKRSHSLQTNLRVLFPMAMASAQMPSLCMAHPVVSPNKRMAPLQEVSSKTSSKICNGRNGRFASKFSSPLRNRTSTSSCFKMQKVCVHCSALVTSTANDVQLHGIASSKLCTKTCIHDTCEPHNLTHPRGRADVHLQCFLWHM